MAPPHEQPQRPPPTPRPDLGPEQVVALLLTALRHNDQPHHDAGIGTLYAFASPRMKGQIGDLAAFGRVLHNTRYTPLLGHSEALVEPLEQIADSARQVVQVVASDGERVRYLFALARKTGGEAAGCWLLTGLQREGIE